MSNIIQQQRTFYIKFQHSESILSEYFGKGILFVDYSISWEEEKNFNTLIVKDSSIDNVKYMSNDEILMDSVFSELPENIQDTLKTALNYVSKTIMPNMINEPKLCKMFSEI
jgi:hypothetical protein